MYIYFLTIKDHTPFYKQTEIALESSDDSQADSCKNQGYEYDEVDLDNFEGGSSSDSSYSISEANQTRNPGGRPTVAPNPHNNITSSIVKEAKAKYKIICRYLNEKQDCKSNGMTMKQLFNSITEEEKENFDLEASFVFSYHTALSRIRRKNLQAEGTYSPLAEIEPQLIELIKCMSKIKRSLTLTKGLHLCNQLIEDTPIQEKLIEYKLSRNIYASSTQELGRVGKHYWKKFLRRNRDAIRAKPGRKFALDRSSWTTIMNFSDMYEHVKQVMIDSKIATRLPEPQWMDKHGVIVDEEEPAAGCKVEVTLNRPDLALVMDEVGCNLSQDSDKRAGSELFLTGKDDEAYKSISTKHKHFTVMGVTALNGYPVLCVVVISGKKGEIPAAAGIDWNAVNPNDTYDIKEGDEVKFFRDNRGKGSIFPQGPVCHFKGKTIPSFVAFSESGGMDGKILTDVLRHLDKLEVFHDDRKEGYTPFLLLDGHQSRFELEFLRYINDPDTKWSVCIGVPYGTSLWQVGDSSQQNGKFKVLITKKKRELFDERMKKFQQHLHLLTTDIMIIVKEAWEEAFGNIESNLEAISQRGWNPLNKMLLIHPIILATITESRIKFELQRNIFPSKILQELDSYVYTVTNGQVKFTVQDDANPTPFNFKGGCIATHVANTIIAETDREEARERNQRLKSEGKSIAERVASITKCMTAGKLVVEAGSFHLNEDVLQQAELRLLQQVEKENNARIRDEAKYMIDCYKADRALDRNVTADVSKWKKSSDIVDHLRPLRHKDDKAMPTKRADLELRYLQWNNRRRSQNVYERQVHEIFNTWLAKENAKKNTKTSNGGEKPKRKAGKK